MQYIAYKHLLSIVPTAKCFQYSNSIAAKKQEKRKNNIQQYLQIRFHIKFAFLTTLFKKFIFLHFYLCR